jgi:hypothetical protein
MKSVVECSEIKMKCSQSLPKRSVVSVVSVVSVAKGLGQGLVRFDCENVAKC